MDRDNRHPEVDKAVDRWKPIMSGPVVDAIRQASLACGGDDNLTARYARSSGLIDEWDHNHPASRETAGACR